MHQFDKVEMFSYVDPADAEAEHARLLEHEKAFLTDLELTFRVIDVAAGDLGSSASRKFDCEAWLPSQDRWLELTSTSNCTDFQARRLGVRVRTPDGPRVAATLNGTLCAIGRTIAVLLEVHQREDGSVHVPKALQPYLGCRGDRPFVKLVASDLDGTLIRSDGTVSARSRDAIAAVEAAGATFVMVTGRPPRWMRSIAEETGHRGLAICANGAILYDLHTDAVLETFLLPAAVAVQVAHALRDRIPGVAFAAEHHERAFAHEAAYKPRWDSADPRITTTIEELLQDDVVKLLARHPSLGPDELLEQAVAAVGDAVTVTHSSTDGLLEISAHGDLEGHRPGARGRAARRRTG